MVLNVFSSTVYIFFSALLSDALPALSAFQPLSLNFPPSNLSIALNQANATNLGAPRCFGPGSHEGLYPTNFGDCQKAMEQLVSMPDFSIRFTFSRDERRGIKVPIRWRFGECLIFLSCLNEKDVDAFSYLDVTRTAYGVFRTCVDVQAPVLPWGGVDMVGRLKSFYVSIGGPIRIGPNNVTGVADGMSPGVLDE